MVDSAGSAYAATRGPVTPPFARGDDGRDMTPASGGGAGRAPLPEEDGTRRGTRRTPLKIAHVVRQFSPGVGGMEDVVLQLASQQVAAGHHVTVVTLDRIFDDPEAHRLPERDVVRGVLVERAPFRGSTRYPIAPGVLARLPKDADVVHVHGIDFLADFLALTQPLHRRRLLLSTHGGFFHTSFASGLKKLWFHTVTRLALTRYAAVFASSPSDEETFRRIRKRGLLTIENGVSIHKFHASAGLEAKTMIYFGRLAPNKNVTGVIRWFAGIRAADPEWRLVVAGKPMGVTVADLQQAARAAGVAEAVEIVDTPSDEDLAALVARSCVFVCGSTYEGFGLAAYEAAAAGLLPVLSDIAPFRRAVDRAGYGHVTAFAPENAARDLDAITAAFAADRRDRILALREAIGWHNVTRRFMALYREACGDHSRRLGRVKVAVETYDSATDWIHRRLREGGPAVVAFCNQHTVNMAASNDRFAAALDEAYVLNDGVALDVQSKAIFGRSFPQNLNGTDFTPHILDTAERPLRVFLLGAKPGVAERAAAALGEAFPRHRFVGTQNGYFSPSEDDAIVAAIADTRPDLVLVGMGHPRQEIFAATHAERLGCTVMCIGAFIDFAAGEVDRAPEFLRRTRLEWLFRLAKEPRRMAARYLVGGVTFMGRTVKQWAGGARV